KTGGRSTGVDRPPVWRTREAYFFQNLLKRPFFSTGAAAAPGFEVTMGLSPAIAIRCWNGTDAALSEGSAGTGFTVDSGAGVVGVLLEMAARSSLTGVAGRGDTNSGFACSASTAFSMWAFDSAYGSKPSRVALSSTSASTGA